MHQWGLVQRLWIGLDLLSVIVRFSFEQVRNLTTTYLLSPLFVPLLYTQDRQFFSTLYPVPPSLQHHQSTSCTWLFVFFHFLNSSEYFSIFQSDYRYLWIFTNLTYQSLYAAFFGLCYLHLTLYLPVLPSVQPSRHPTISSTPAIPHSTIASSIFF